MSDCRAPLEKGLILRSPPSVATAADLLLHRLATDAVAERSAGQARIAAGWLRSLLASLEEVDALLADGPTREHRDLLTVARRHLAADVETLRRAIERATALFDETLHQIRPSAPPPASRPRALRP